MDETRPPTSELGKTIAEKYRLLRVIGVGGMGVVYEALHAVTHRRVAVKLLDRSISDAMPTAAAARFLREAQAPASIGHPGIVDVLDAGRMPDGALYLVFELLEGEDFETVLQRRLVMPLELVDICVSVLDVLAAAHEHGFVHRDIKPANIFLAKSRVGNTVKLLDFGVAKRVDAVSGEHVTALGSIIGTLEYMSPEQALGDTIDARSDLWSVGAVLYRGLAGHPPFTAQSQFDLVHSLLTAPIPSLREIRPDLPPLLLAAVDRALQRAKDVRWASAQDMKDALRGCGILQSSTDFLREWTDKEPLNEEEIRIALGDATERAEVPAALMNIPETGDLFPETEKTPLLRSDPRVMKLPEPAPRESMPMSEPGQVRAMMALEATQVELLDLETAPPAGARLSLEPPALNAHPAPVTNPTQPPITIERETIEREEAPPPEPPRLETSEGRPAVMLALVLTLIVILIALLTHFRT